MNLPEPGHSPVMRGFLYALALMIFLVVIVVLVLSVLA